MNRNSSTKALVESGLMTALTVVLMLAASYLPILGYAAMFVWPLPIAMVYVRHGKKYSILALVASGIISGLILGSFLSSLSMIVSFGLASVILGYCIVHKKPAHLTIVMMAAAIFIGMLIMLKTYSVVFGQDLITMTIDTFNQSIETVKQMYSSMNIPEETINTVLGAIDTNKIVMIMPIALAGSALGMAFISYLIAGKLFKRFDCNMDPVKHFSQWYLPRGLVFAVTLIVLIAYLSNYTKLSLAESYFNNAYLAFIYMFLINGLSAMDFFLSNKGIPKAFRIIICVLAALSGLSTILMFVGLVDNALNLRKLDKTRIRNV